MSRYPQILTREAALDRQLTAEMAIEAQEEMRPNAMKSVANGFATFAVLLLLTAGLPTYIVICWLGWV